MPDLDPLSQLIGAQTAQIAELGRSLGDIRTEIVNNRNTNLTFQRELDRKFDLLEAELRNVKHDSRSAEFAHQTLKESIDKASTRIANLELLATEWRARITLVAALITGIASVMGLFLPPLIDRAITYIFHTGVSLP